MKEVTTPTMPVQDFVDGSQNPELFLPTELYSNFVMIMFDPRRSESSARTREAVAAKWKELGLPGDPDAALASEGRRVMDLIEESAAADRSERNPGRKPAIGSDTEVSPQPERDVQACRDLLESLRAAERIAGEEQFLRILYEVIAPRGKVLSFTPGQEADLRRLEDGCR